MGRIIAVQVSVLESFRRDTSVLSDMLLAGIAVADAPTLWMLPGIGACGVEGGMNLRVGKHKARDGGPSSPSRVPQEA